MSRNYTMETEDPIAGRFNRGISTHKTVQARVKIQKAIQDRTQNPKPNKEQAND